MSSVKVVECAGVSVEMRLDRKTGEFVFSVYRSGKKAGTQRHKVKELFERIGIKIATSASSPAPAPVPVKKETLGEALVKVRGDLPRTQVADRAKVSVDALRRLEADRVKAPDRATVYRVLEACGVSRDSFGPFDALLPQEGAS